MFAKYMRKRKIFASILILPILVILLHNIVPHHHHEEPECLCAHHDSHDKNSEIAFNNSTLLNHDHNGSHEDDHICFFTVDILVKHQNPSTWINSININCDDVNQHTPKSIISEDLPEVIFIKEQKAFLSSESLRAPPVVA